LRRVGDDFEEEYPGASALATECYANVFVAGDKLMELHDDMTRREYGISSSARQVLSVVEGAGEPLEPSVIAARVLIARGSMTSVLDTLERRGLIRRTTHPDDRRRILVDITPEAQRLVDALLPAMHAREREVMSDALSEKEQRQLLSLIAKVQQAAVRAQSVPPPAAEARVRRPRAKFDLK
jgi:DNA-binding MarR family transcriptional regulator